MDWRFLWGQRIVGVRLTAWVTSKLRSGRSPWDKWNIGRGGTGVTVHDHNYGRWQPQLGITKDNVWWQEAQCWLLQRREGGEWRQWGETMWPLWDLQNQPRRRRRGALCDPVDCSLSGSSVHGVSQARILEWVAMPSSRGSSWTKAQTQVSYISCTGRQILYH